MDIKDALLAKRRRAIVSREGALSTGSTLLNLACTDDPYCGFLKGGFYLIVGDSGAGKTFLTQTCFAEAVVNEYFKKYRLYFDDVEGGALMDQEYFFGKETAKRVEAPRYVKGEPVYSDMIEDLYDNLAEIIADKEPFVYVLDSQDALGSSASAKKQKEQRKDREEGEETTGSYGDGKAKYHSDHLRTVLSGVRKLDSILIYISQTRDNVGSRGYGDKKTRSGGKALKFYANVEIWLALGKPIVKRVRGEERTIGVRCRAHVKKNRVTGKIGKDREVEIPIYFDYGIDDIGSCVDYLIKYKHWKEVGVEKRGRAEIPVYKTPELLFKGTRWDIVDHIEKEGLESKLIEATAQCWREIEEECTTERKRRYE